MDKTKATEYVALALEALRDLEDAKIKNDRRTMDLKIEVLRQALFGVLEIIQLDKND